VDRILRGRSTLTKEFHLTKRTTVSELHRKDYVISRLLVYIVYFGASIVVNVIISIEVEASLFRLWRKNVNDLSMFAVVEDLRYGGVQSRYIAPGVFVLWRLVPSDEFSV
jgi:hypothetical protein